MKVVRESLSLAFGMSVQLTMPFQKKAEAAS